MFTRRTTIIGQFTRRSAWQPLLQCKPRHAGVHDGWPTKADEAEEAARELQRQAVDLRDGARLTKPLEALRNQQGLASAHLRDAIYDTQISAGPFLAIKENYALSRLNELQISVVEKEDLAVNISTLGRIIESRNKQLESRDKQVESMDKEVGRLDKEGEDQYKRIEESKEAAEKCKKLAETIGEKYLSNEQFEKFQREDLAANIGTLGRTIESRNKEVESINEQLQKRMNEGTLFAVFCIGTLAMGIFFNDKIDEVIAYWKSRSGRSEEELKTAKQELRKFREY